MWDVKISPDGIYVAGAYDKGEVKLFEHDTLKEIKSVKAHNNCTYSCIFTNDSKLLITGGGKNSDIKILTVPELKEVKAL